MQSIADKQIYRPYIDGLRGLAVLAVLAVHLPVGPSVFAFSVSEQLVAAGARGVQLFFLLSAFTLFRSSKSKYHTESSPRRNFYIRRFFRIVPLWWLAVLVYAVSTGRSLADSLPSLLMYFGFIRFDPATEVFPLGWSIFVEETFYILLPVIFAYITGLRKALHFFFVLALAAVAWIKGAPLLGIPAENYFISLFPVSQWPCLALGIVIYFISEHEWFNRVFLKNAPMLRISEALAFLLLLAFYNSNFLVMTIPLFVVFLVSISGRTVFGKISRIGIIQQFGICCYSIYLFHIFLIGPLEPFRIWFLDTLRLSSSAAEIKFLVWYPVFAAINLALGLACFKFIERPCVGLGKKLIRGLEYSQASSPVNPDSIRR